MPPIFLPSPPAQASQPSSTTGILSPRDRPQPHIPILGHCQIVATKAFPAPQDDPQGMPLMELKY